MEQNVKFSVPEMERYARHMLLPEVGIEGQAKLKDGKVLVVGAGGLGSPVLLYLAAAGVGTIGVVDFDSVEISNLQRQIVHGEASTGCSKIVSARERILKLNSGIDVQIYDQELEGESAARLFRGYDIVVDGTDNFTAREVIDTAGAQAGIPVVWGAIYRFEGQVSVFWNGHGPRYRDLYPGRPPSEFAPSCSVGGVVGVVCGIIGSVMAAEVVKFIVGIGELLLGRLLILDVLSMRWSEVEVRSGMGSAVESVRPEQDSALEDVTGCGCSVADVVVMQSSGLKLIDVREPKVFEFVKIEGAINVPIGILREEGLPGECIGAPTVVYCKSGPRSQEAVRVLRSAGVRDVRYLRGGIEAWVRSQGLDLPLY